MGLPIILASSSPRRRLLLKETGIKFKIFSCHLDERITPKEKVEEFSLRIAKEKALKASIKSKGIIIAADTVIKCNNSVIGKPKNKKQAAEILSLLSGKKHAVITSLVLYNTYSKKFYTKCVKTFVTMDKLTSEEIRNYVKTGESLDKAGGYAIQGKGKFFISKIEGCYFNVVGLPLHTLSKMLKKIGISVFKSF